VKSSTSWQSESGDDLPTLVDEDALAAKAGRSDERLVIPSLSDYLQYIRVFSCAFYDLNVCSGLSLSLSLSHYFETDSLV
jgi:hypothetical protein